jgi:hypothetical protein
MFVFSLLKLVPAAVNSCLRLLSIIATLREYLYGISADPRHTYFDKQRKRKLNIPPVCGLNTTVSYFHIAEVLSQHSFGLAVLVGKESKV